MRWDERVVPQISQRRGVLLGTDPASIGLAKVLGSWRNTHLVTLPLRKLRYTGEREAIVSRLGSI